MPKKTIHAETLAALPEKAREYKRKNDMVMAAHARDYQKRLYDNNGKRGTLSSLDTILNIKALWETGAYSAAEIAEELGMSIQTTKSAVAALNKTQFMSPQIRALAVKATKDILENCPDDNIRLKMITKIFPDEQTQQVNGGVRVNLNIKGSDLALKNPDFEYNDLDNF